MHNLEHYLRQIRLIAEHREKDAEKKIRKLYKTLDKDLKEFLGTQYAELAQDGKLTYEILHSKKRYARFMEEVAGHVDLCSSRAAKQIKKTVNEIYALSFDGMIDAVEQSKDYYDLKANLKGVKATTPSIIKNAVSNSFLEEALKKNHASAIYDIKQNIGISLSNGDRIETTAKRLSEQINKDYNKSVLIARTETHRIREAGMQDSSEEIAKNLDDDYVMVKIWKTMKDERVRPQVRYKTKSGWKSSRSRNGADHMKMEGQTVLVDEVFDLGGGVTAKTPGQSGSAAHDCNCRCYLSRDFMTRAEYKQLTGKSIESKTGSTDLKSKIQKIKDDIVKNKGIINEDHILAAGKAVQDDLIALREPLKKKFDDLKNEYENFELKKKYNKLDSRRKEVRTRLRSLSPHDPQRKELEAELMRLQRECTTMFDNPIMKEYQKNIRQARRAYEGTYQFNANELKSKLSEFRTVGIGKYDLNKVHYSNKGTLRKVVTDAYDCYPSDWVEASVKYGTLDVVKVNRGYYGRQQIAISGYDYDSQFETAIHELGHRFEKVVDGVLSAEKTFYDRRTKGEKLEWLGAPYSKSEKTRRDKFISPYMGKDYYETAYELVSMGFEFAFTDPTRLWKDEEYARFIYGILSLY